MGGHMHSTHLVGGSNTEERQTIEGSFKGKMIKLLVERLNLKQEQEGHVLKKRHKGEEQDSVPLSCSPAE